MSAVKKATHRDLARRIDSLESEIEDLRDELDGVDSECAECERRERDKVIDERKAVEKLAARMVRETTTGDIAWLSFDERERFLELARIAVKELR